MDRSGRIHVHFAANQHHRKQHIDLYSYLHKLLRCDEHAELYSVGSNCNAYADANRNTDGHSNANRDAYTDGDANRKSGLPGK